MAFQLPDPSTPFGERVAHRLREDHVIWFTTVDAKGTPQPNPVWFLWEEATSTVLMYSQPVAKRLAHIQQNPRVSLNFEGDEYGDDIIIIIGEARVSPDAPPADEIPALVEKYRAAIARIYGASDEMEMAKQFASSYSVAIRIYPEKIRGFL